MCNHFFNDYCSDYEIYRIPDEMSNEDALSICWDADCMLASLVKPVDEALISKMPYLKMIHSEAVGFDNIDIAYAEKRGIYVCNSAGANAKAVAENTILLMLSVLRELPYSEYTVRNNLYFEGQNHMTFCGLPDLGQCHVGLIGFGDIGKSVAALLKGFGSKVSYYKKTLQPKEEADIFEKYCARYLDLTEIFKECDIISLHVPATSATIGMINSEALALMKPTAIIINTARGKLIDQSALAEAISKDQIFGAGLEVQYEEPVAMDDKILNLPGDKKFRVVLTPHCGGKTPTSFRNAYDNLQYNLRRIYEGKRPRNIVNGL